MKRVKIGDVLDVLEGLALAQYTHKNRLMGPLIRVLPGFHASRPASLGTLLSGPTQFFIFFPVPQAVNQQMVEVIGNEPVPLADQPFPLFRDSIPSGPATVAWWLWDGERSWRVGDLTPDQYKIQLRRQVNEVALVQMIEQGFTPERMI